MKCVRYIVGFLVFVERRKDMNVLDKVFVVMAEQSNFSPAIAVWFPNILFGILAIYLLYNAKR